MGDLPTAPSVLVNIRKLYAIYALPPSNIICSDTYWAAIPTYYTSK
jgi:hypothetical protein